MKMKRVEVRGKAKQGQEQKKVKKVRQTEYSLFYVLMGMDYLDIIALGILCIGVFI